MAAGRLTVLQLLPALEGGGVERGTLEVARALVGAGHRSLVMSAGGRMIGQLQAEGSEHLTWDIGRKHLATLRLIRPLRRLLLSEGIDIVHVRSRVPAWILEFALRGLPPDQRPIRVSTVHGLYSVSRYSAIMTRGDRIVAVSNAVRDYILDNYPQCPPERIEVIPRGVDPEEFPLGYQAPPVWREAFFKQFPDARGKILLTLPGRLTRLKGHHDFIELVEGLIRRGQPVHGLIVGGEDPRRRAYAAELRRAVAQRGLDRHISFTGPRGDIRDIYSISSVVLSLSTKPESFGRTVAEALSLGIPVIGWSHGGVGELLDEHFPSGSVPLGDGHGLEARIIRLVDSRHPEPLTPPPSLQEMLRHTLAMYAELSRQRPSDFT